MNSGNKENGPKGDIIKGETIELTVEKLVPGGDGMARHEGKVVFIPATLPGERVKVRLVESKKDFARAHLVEILTASPMRREPPCPVAKICGGCDWQHIHDEDQLRQKVALTEDAFRRTGGFAFPGLSIEPGKPLRYRNRVQIHRDGSGRLGFLAKASHNIVPVTSCPVAHPALDKVLAENSVLGDRRFPAWAHTLENNAGEFLISGEAGCVEPGFSVPILGRDIHFDLRCFFQSNLDMLAKLLPYVLDGLQGKTAMDLYCGVGLFGAFLQDRFTHVMAVEENPVALDYARRNIDKGKVFLQGKLEDLILDRQVELVGFRPDLVLVDPPRPGLDPEVVAFLLDRSPQQLIYVSCNPVTLARDLKILLAGGYVIDDLRLFDFYPQTAHVEAVAKLKKA